MCVREREMHTHTHTHMHARAHTQAGLLTAAFYFVYHTTSPLLVDWASDGKEKQLAFEFDFAYFYSSMLAVVAIGLMFASTGKPLLTVI